MYLSTFPRILKLKMKRKKCSLFIDENLEVEDQAIELQDDMDNQQNQRNSSVSQPLAVRAKDTSQRSPKENKTTVTDYQRSWR